MKDRAPAEWAIRLILSAAAVVAGWYGGTEIGVLAGLALDKASGGGFLSAAYVTIPLFGLIGSIVGIWLAYRLVRRQRLSN